MTIESRTFPLRQAMVGFNYDTRHRFFNVAGALTDELAEYLPALFPELDDQEVRFLDEVGNPRVRISSEQTWFMAVGSPGEEIPMNAIEDALEEVWETVQRALQVGPLERVGFRTFNVLGFSDVDDAVQSFRSWFFDYYEAPLKALGGQPRAVDLGLRVEGIGEGRAGQQINAVLRLMPIHMTPEIASDLSVDPEVLGGGWVIDLDAYAENVGVETARDLIADMAEASRKLFLDLSTEIRERSDAIGA